MLEHNHQNNNNKFPFSSNKVPYLLACKRSVVIHSSILNLGLKILLFLSFIL